MKATPLKKGVGGKLASRKSKTGNPECSRAMSLWVRARHAGASVGAEVFKILGKCRSQARMLSGAQNQANAGNEARAQVLRARAARGLTMGERAAKAKELRAGRAAKFPEARQIAERVKSRVATRRERTAALAAGESPKVREVLGYFDAKGQNLRGGDVIRAALKDASASDLATLRAHIDKQGPENRGRWNRWLGGELAGEQRARAARPAAAPAPPAPAPAPAGEPNLFQRYAAERANPKSPRNRAARAFEAMKRGDLPGQTSLLDRVPSVDTKTGEVVSRQKAKMAAAVKAITKSTGKPVKDIPAAIRHAKLQGAQARARGDVVGSHQWSQHEAALIAHQHGGKAKKTGGWNRAPEETASKTAELVAKTREARKQRARVDSAMSRVRAQSAEIRAKRETARAKQAKEQARIEGLRSKIAEASGKLHALGGKPAATGAAVTTRANLAPSEQAKPLKRISERETMKGRREKTAAAIKDFRGKLERYSNVAEKGKPGDTGYVPTDRINFDPERFQFKQSAQGKHGVTDQFKETKKWNPELAGVISAWRDPADGKLYVVNGHHRADLAKRLGVKDVRVQLLNARDASEARAKGAIENIGEGRGTAYDAAKFLRENGVTSPKHLEEHGVNLGETTAKKGLALASLHPTLFKKYEAGTLPEERAALIGGSGLSHAQQEAVMKSVKKGTNNSTLRELIDNAHAAGSVKSQTRDLFGTSEEEVSLAHHRATVQAHVRDAILADKRLYSLVSRSKSAASLEERQAGRVDTGKAGEISQESRQLLDLYDRLKNRSGAPARALQEATEELHAGKPRKETLSRARKAVIAELERMLKGGKEGFAA